MRSSLNHPDSGVFRTGPSGILHAIVLIAACFVAGNPAVAQDVGWNRKRNANTNPSAPTPPNLSPPDCGGAADQMRGEHDALVQDYEVTAAALRLATSSDDSVFIHAELENINQRLLDLQHQWESMEAQCGNQGSLAGNPSSPAAGGASTGSAAGGGGGGGGGGGAAGGGGGAPGGAGGAGGGHKGSPKTDLMIALGMFMAHDSGSQTGRGVTNVVGRGRLGREALSRTWQQVDQPQPAPDYHAVPVAAPPPSAPVPDNPAQLHDGLAADNALEREVAQLAAFALALDDYLGAKAANDSAAMRQQADAMVGLIDSAMVAAFQTSQLSAQAEQALAHALDSLEHAPGGLRQILTAARKDSSQLEAAAAGDTSAAHVTQALLDSLRRLDPKTAATEIRNLRAEAAVDSGVAAKLAANIPPEPWPVPPDMDRLARARRQAYEIKAGLPPAPAAPAVAPPPTAAPQPPAKRPQPHLWWILPISAVLALGWYAWWVPRREKAAAGTKP